MTAVVSYTPFAQVNDIIPAMLNYIALGSSHEVAVRSFTIPTSTGTKTVTTFPWQPECVIVCGVVTLALNEAFDGAFMHWGVATSATDQWGMGIYCADNVGSPYGRSCRWGEDRFIYSLNNGAPDFEGEFTQFLSNGFEYELHAAPGIGLAAMAIGMRGGDYSCGVDEVPASTGTQSIPHGINAEAFFMGSVVKMLSELDANDIDNDVSMSMGAGDGTRQHSISASSRLGSGNTASWQSPTTIATLTETVAGASNLLAQAELTDVNDGSGNAELNWTTVDGNDYRFGWLAISDAVVDRFEYTTPGSGGTFETVNNPKGFIGFNLTLQDDWDDFGGVAGMHLGFSGVGTAIDDEMCCGWWDADSPPFSVQQSGRHFRVGVFGAPKPEGGGVASTGNGFMIHRLDITAIRRRRPQIYRRVIQRGRVRGLIDMILSSFGAGHSTITSEVPDRYDFTEGETGTSISDGGNDMYDGGNTLSTNLGGPIPYTDGEVKRSSGFFGAGSTYFTTKEQGIFAMVAMGVNVSSFQVDGNLGADGQGLVDATTLQTTVNGQLYTIFVKRVYATETGTGSADPSINQIIIVPGDGTGITHTWSSDTNDGFQKIDGLAGIDRIYYLVVSRYVVEVEEGLPLTNVAEVAEEFLTMLTEDDPDDPVAHMVAELPTRYEEITSLIPNLYLFEDGLTGDNIGDGGDDMYDTGNIVRTILDEFSSSVTVPYTNNASAAGDLYFGAGSTYATIKVPGLWALVTKDTDFLSFAITGGLGADGTGIADTVETSVTVEGQEWSIYCKRVYDADNGDPSVNHILMIPGDGTGVNHWFETDTDDDYHEIEPVDTVNQVHYVLVSRMSETYSPKLEDADVIDVVEAFLSLLP